MIVRLALALHRSSRAARGARGRPVTAAGLVAALFAAAPVAAPAQEKAAALPGLAGLDHVVIGVNDVAGALSAYQRLGFTVLRLEAPAGGGPGGLVDLGSGFLEFMTPSVDSLGKPQPFTFEGAVGQGWEIGSSREVAAFLRAAGGETTDPVAATFALAPDPAAGVDAAQAVTPAGPTFTLSEPREQPISGSAVYFVEYDEPKLRGLFEEIVRRAEVGDPTDHPNGAVELAYVTVAVSRLEPIVKVLESWGLDTKPLAYDPRGGQTSEVDLPRGKLYLITPTSAGGINDFLEERRAKAPPVGSRYFEGTILAVGIGVEDLDATIDWLTDHKVPYIPMDLPSGRVEVVQGAPGWGLRIEFVQAGKDRSAQWAAHRGGGSAGAAAGGASSSSSDDTGGSR